MAARHPLAEKKERKKGGHLSGGGGAMTMAKEREGRRREGVEREWEKEVGRGAVD